MIIIHKFSIHLPSNQITIFVRYLPIKYLQLASILKPNLMA